MTTSGHFAVTHGLTVSQLSVFLDHGIFIQLLPRPSRKRLCMAPICTALRLEGSQPKNTLPSQQSEALEAQPDREPFPSNPPSLRILKARKSLQETFRNRRQTSCSWSDQTERLADCSRIASTEQYGCESQAKLRPFIYNHHERTQTNVNK